MRRDGEIGTPHHVPGPGGPWRGMCREVAGRGHAVAYAMWEEWLPALLADPGLHRLLGQDRPRWLRITDPAVRHRFAASRALVKYAAAAALRTTPTSLELAYEPGGRPYLRGVDRLNIGITHTGSLVAVCLSAQGRIGVDAERSDRRIDEATMLARLCTGAERNAAASLPVDERRAALLRLWTLKEAYAKALGQGLRLGFSGFGVSPEDGRLLAPDGSPAAEGQWAFATFQVRGHHLVSTAHHSPAFGHTTRPPEPAGASTARRRSQGGDATAEH